MIFTAKTGFSRKTDVRFSAIFDNSLCQLALFGVSFFGQKITLNRAISVGKSVFFEFFDNFRVFLAKKKNFFFLGFLGNFLQPKPGF